MSTTFSIPMSTRTFEYLLEIIDDDTVEDCEFFTFSLTSLSVPPGFRLDKLSIDHTKDKTISTISVDETG